jgi:hypothetical protein
MEALAAQGREAPGCTESNQMHEAIKDNMAYMDSLCRPTSSARSMAGEGCVEASQHACLTWAVVVAAQLAAAVAVAVAEGGEVVGCSTHSPRRAVEKWGHGL